MCPGDDSGLASSDTVLAVGGHFKQSRVFDASRRIFGICIMKASSIAALQNQKPVRLGLPLVSDSPNFKMNSAEVVKKEVSNDKNESILKCHMFRLNLLETINCPYLLICGEIR